MPVNKWTKPKAPVRIEFYDTQNRKYRYVDDMQEVPNRKQIQRDLVPTYGPGRYRVTDSTTPDPNCATWEIGEDLRSETGAPDQDEDPPTTWAPRQESAEDVAERAARAVMDRMGASYRPPAYAPPPPPTPSQSMGGADPYVTDLLRRLDTAIHQVHSQLGTLEDRLSRLSFEVREIPQRVGGDVRDALQTAGDPEERVANLWAMLQDMQGGIVPGEDSTPGWLRQLGQVAGAALGGAPQLGGPPANGGAGTPVAVIPGPFGPLGGIPGIDADRAASIQRLTAQLGQPVEVAAQVAAQYQMNADQLIEWGAAQVAASSPSQPVEPTQKEEDPTVDPDPDNDRPGAKPG